MNRMAWLIRREFWEHRAIWMAPLVVLALLLVGAVTGNVMIGNVHIDADMATGNDSEVAQQATRQAVQPAGPPAEETAMSAEERAKLDKLHELHKLDKLGELKDSDGKTTLNGHVLSPGEALAVMQPAKRQALLVVVYAAVAAVMFFVLGTIGFFYSLDALYADRRDRSVLFWKSLPLSDTETVLSKFVVAAVAIPVVAAIAAFAGQLITAAGGSLKLAMTGGDAALMWMPQVIGASWLAAAAMAVICALWFAPVTAYLLLASSWAPRSPFLWAVLPPIALSMVERIAFGSTHVASFLKHRMLAPFQALFQQQNIDSMKTMSVDLAGGVMHLLLSPGMLLGLVAAAALLAGTVWVRRYRDESI